MRHVVLYEDNEDGGWIGEVLSLPGCVSQGETRDETLCNVEEAIEAWISAAEIAGRAIPPEPGAMEVVQIRGK
jgi:predicted RNase H-like HicB family nuclease